MQETQKRSGLGDQLFRKANPMIFTDSIFAFTVILVFGGLGLVLGLAIGGISCLFGGPFGVFVKCVTLLGLGFGVAIAILEETP